MKRVESSSQVCPVTPPIPVYMKKIEIFESNSNALLKSIQLVKSLDLRLVKESARKFATGFVSTGFDSSWFDAHA